MKPWHLAVAVLAVLSLPLLALVALVAGGVAANQPTCPPPGPGPGGPAVLPAARVGAPGTVAGFSGASLAGAAQIMRAGADHGFGVDGQTIAVMTAMDESGLAPLPYGDAAGPNSRGWFQQRDWGPVPDELDAYKSATMFFVGGQHGEPGLQSVPGWELMTPTHAAHAVQRNADPEVYTRFYPRAQQVVAALGGGLPANPAAAAAPAACPPATPAVAAGAVPATPGGWARPALGTLSSGFSPARVNPVTGVTEAHKGQDIANACGTPIYAAAAGTVISSGPASGYGNWIRLDHGNGVITIYGHMKATDLLVRVGQQVTAGQQISRIGAEGQATGCHLHVQVEVNGTAVDPVPFFAARGVSLSGAP